MSETRLPFVPFDPRKRGPFDVLRDYRAKLSAFVEANSTVLILAAVALVLGAWYLDVSLPPIPTWVKVATVASVLVAIPIGSVLGIRLAAGLDTDERVLLSQQAPIAGDQELKRVAPDVFDRMRIINHNGEERGSEFLKTVMINGQKAYEVDHYDEEENVAVASWMAGATNSEVRQSRARIDYIKTKAEEEADKALELLANHPMILREQGREVSMQLVKVAEGIEVPEGDSLHERLQERLDASDPSDDLLGRSDDEDDSSSGSDEDRSSISSVRDRAEALVDDLEDVSSNGSEVPADD